MDKKIIDSENLFVNAEECQRLSYEMLFSDNEYQNGNSHSEHEEKNENGEQQRSQREQLNELKQLKKKWEQKLEDAKEDAYQQGFEEGKQQGEDQAMDAIEQQVESLKETLVSVDGRINELMDDLKPHIATMVFDVTEKIIGLPVKSETLKEQVAAEVRDTLSSIQTELQINVKVAATDYGYIVRALKDLPNTDHIEITSTESLNTGEYSIDTEHERVVKSFKKMLQDFRESVALEDEELEVAE